LRRAILAALLALSAAAAQADVYTWRDASGVKRMSNVAPPWFRDTGRTSPRVQVLVNGILVDDTGVSDEERLKLREQRARAEVWGTRKPPATATASQAAAAPAPAAEAKAKPAADAKAKPPPPPLPGGIDPAKAGEGLKSALEAQKQLDAVTDQLKARPK
jgi:hypothetical protein